MVAMMSKGPASRTIDPFPRPTFDFTAKLFSNMKLNWDGPHMSLFAPMLVVPSVRDGADVVATEPTTMPHDLPLLRFQSLGSVKGSLTLNELTILYTTLSKKVEDFQSDLQQTKLTYGATYTKLILRVKKLEHKVKTSQHRRKAIVVISDDEEYLEDPFKQGRKITKIDENPLYFIEPTELVEDLGSGEKGEKEISTVIPKISTAAENLVYIRRKIAKQLQEAIAEADSAHDIDWNDPIVLRYHALQNRSFSKAEEVMKKFGFDLQQKQFAEEVSEKKDDSSSKSVGGSRKKTVAKKMIVANDEESAKRQKLKDVTEEEATAEYEKEKEEFRLSLKIIHNDDIEVNYEPLSRNFPIVS
nr:hypothetical protein [Tanacetum cinerariifolium]